MNLRTIAARTAVAGTATALAAGALVGLGATAAHADTGTAQYDCTVLPGTTVPVVMTLAADLPAASWETHTPVPGGILSIDGSVTVPAAVAQGLAQKGIDKVGIGDNDFGLTIGSAKIPLTGVAADRTAVPASGDLNLPFTASIGTFTMPDAGSYSISMPASFTADLLTHSAAGDSSIPSVPCTLDPTSTAAIDPFTVTKQSSTAKVSGPASVKKGKVAKYVVSVSGDATAVTGKVVAKDGKASLGSAALKNGKATFSLKKLKAGKHKLTFSYAGDKNTNATSVSKTVTVK